MKYLVGERGPELFRSTKSLRVMSNEEFLRRYRAGEFRRKDDDSDE